MDAALSLPDDVYSDMLREHADLMSAQMAYGSAAAVLERLLGASLSTSVLKRLVERDGREVVGFYDDHSPQEDHSPHEDGSGSGPRAEAPVLVAQADGKGVPMRPSSAPPPGAPGLKSRESAPRSGWAKGRSARRKRRPL